VQFLAVDSLGEEINCDLLISNYAFTESSRELQKNYLDKFSSIVNGYIVCNFFSKQLGVDALSKEELLEAFHFAAFPVELLPEEPQTGEEHCILMWRQ